jgi:hypothetical protein
MNQWYIKFFRKLPNTTVLISVITYRKSLGCKVDHLNFRTYLTEDLLVKYSVQCKIPGNLCDENIVMRLTDWHIPRRILPTENKCEPKRQYVVCSKHGFEKRLYYCHDCDVALCVAGDFEAHQSYKTNM